MRMAFTGQALAASTAWGTSSGGMGAGLGHGQHALHVEYGGAQPGALGAADAQVRVNECDHKICLLRMMSAASMGGFGAKYARHLRAAVV